MQWYQMVGVSIAQSMIDSNALQKFSQDATYLPIYHCRILPIKTSVLMLIPLLYKSQKPPAYDKLAVFVIVFFYLGEKKMSKQVRKRKEQALP